MILITNVYNQGFFKTLGGGNSLLCLKLLNFEVLILKSEIKKKRSTINGRIVSFRLKFFLENLIYREVFIEFLAEFLGKVFYLIKELFFVIVESVGNPQALLEKLNHVGDGFFGGSVDFPQLLEEIGLVEFEILFDEGDLLGFLRFVGNEFGSAKLFEFFLDHGFFTGFEFEVGKRELQVIDSFMVFTILELLYFDYEVVPDGSSNKFENPHKKER